MTRTLIALLCIALLAAGCGQSDAPQDEDRVSAPVCAQADESGNVRIQEGLTAEILKKGYGRVAVSKDYADVHTTLWLYDENADDGKGQEIWTSGGIDPFQFQIDSGQVIEGWDRGVTCMMLGEKRRLRIAPELGYGARGKPPVPPNATLLFEIELINLTAPE